MWWLVAIGVGAGVMLFGMTARARSAIGLTNEDVEYLARMACIEHPNGEDEEIVGIAFVAINRARTRGTTIRDIVTRTDFAGAGANGDRYRRLVESPSGYSEGNRHSPVDHPRFDYVYRLMLQVASGQAENPIGPRDHFIHPHGMDDCFEEGDRSGGRVCFDGKWVPSWAAVNPLWIDNTLFSG